MAEPGPEAVEQLRAGVADLLVAQPYLQVFCSDACLRRFLVARRGIVEDAITSLRCAGTSLWTPAGQGRCACVSRPKQLIVGNIRVRRGLHSAVQLTNWDAAQLVLKAGALSLSQTANVIHLTLCHILKQQCHTDLRRYTLEWRKEAVPEAITWQDVARGGTNGRIEARTGSSSPCLFCHSPCLPLVCSTGVCRGLQQAVLKHADARASLLLFWPGGRREGYSRPANSLLPAAVRSASCKYSRNIVCIEGVKETVLGAKACNTVYLSASSHVGASCVQEASGGDDAG